MKRTQLYLDDDLWQALHNKARCDGTTISEMVRQAARERYFPNLEQRRQVMQAFIGTGKDRPGIRNPVAYVRRLRRGERVERLGKA